MGYDVHHAIVVTGFTPELKEAHAEAIRIFNRPHDGSDAWDLVSPLIEGAANTWKSFFVAPDGSKRGWDTSNEGDQRRAAFLAYLKALENDEGYSPLAWVEVQYGDDDWDTRVVNDSHATRRALDAID